MDRSAMPVAQSFWSGFRCRHYGLDPQKLVYIHLPPSVKRGRQVPLAILVHGGNFLSGSATDENMQPLARYFVERDYAVASVEYRTLQRHRWPTPVEDIRDAIGYLFRSIGEQVATTSLIGYSAGAVAGALLLYSEGCGVINGIDRFVGLSGLYDKDATNAEPILTIRRQSLEGIDLHRVIGQIDWPRMPVPALLVEGCRDTTIDRYPASERSHAERLKALLQAQGIPAQTFWGCEPGMDGHDGPIAMMDKRYRPFLDTLEAFLNQPVRT